MTSVCSSLRRIGRAGFVLVASGCSFDLAEVVEPSGAASGGGAGAAATIDPKNETENPSFEDNVDGWEGNNQIIEHAELADAPHGCCGARVSFAETSDYFSIADASPSVTAPLEGANPLQGAKYRASAYVRATDAVRSGAKVAIRLKDSFGTDYNGAETELTVKFELIELTMSAPCGTTNLRVRISHVDALPGDAFYVDLLQVVKLEDKAATCP